MPYVVVGILAVGITYMVRRVIHRTKMEMIFNGEYCLAEVKVVERYTVTSRSPRHSCEHYYVIVTDRLGNEGKLRITEDFKESLHLCADFFILFVTNNKVVRLINVRDNRLYIHRVAVYKNATKNKHVRRCDSEDNQRDGFDL